MKLQLGTASLGLFLAITAIFGLTPGSTQAGLIKTGSVILDESTNLEWLDLTVTANRFHTEITGAFGDGDEFAGWRYGTAAEIGTLFTSAGYPPGTPGPASPEAAAMIDLLGRTKDAPNGGGSVTIGAAGLYFDSMGIYQQAILEQINPNFISPDGLTEAKLLSTVFISLRFPLPQGHWLVRSAANSTSVPVPGALFVLMIGLAGLGIVRTRHS